jgi:ATP-binding cassette subfamily B protein
MALTSVAELISIGSLFPFLALLSEPEKVYSSQVAEYIINTLQLSTPKQLVLLCALFFGVTSLFAGAMRLFLMWVSTKVAFSTGSDISMDIYRRTLYQPYSVHCSRNSSDLISGITGKTNEIIFGIILPVLFLISSCFLLSVILGGLLYINPSITIVAFGGFGFIYLAIILLTRRALLINSRVTASNATAVIKSLQEGLGGIRDVLINGLQEIYCSAYKAAEMPLRRAQGSNVFISNSPRYAMEALGMTLIAGLAYFLTDEVGGIAGSIPILGMLALCAQRLLPILQQIYSSWVSVRSSQASLQDILNLLDQEIPIYHSYSNLKNMKFEFSISLKDVSFSYSRDMPNVFKGLNITICKGDRIGIIGASGSGKSTLIDLMTGLLQPTSGCLEIDGEVVTVNNIHAWQKHVANVSQTIFLADTTIEENIAFGVDRENIDFQRLRHVSKVAQISETINHLPDQYKSQVGERGVFLSGGQRQRIGIARALYKQADVIIFDEATSALDGETEELVINAINSLHDNITVFIVAHRLTTLKKCSQILEIGDLGIRWSGSYEDLIQRKSVFSTKIKEG